MSGRHIDAEEAHAIGLADKVVPDDQLLEVTLADAEAFASGPTAAYAGVKRAVAEGFGRPIEVALEIEAKEFHHVFSSQDARIGVRAFLDKESPEFTGR